MVKTDGGTLNEFRRWSTRVKSNAALFKIMEQQYN